MDPLRHQTIVRVPVGDLKGYDRNARLHSDAQVAQVAASIMEFGFTNPVLVDERNVIIAGHGRVQAAKSLAMVEVPCIRVTGLTDAQRRALVLADNKIALNATWDDRMLAEELKALQESVDLGDLDFALSEVVGFSDAEVTDLLKVLDETQDDGEGPRSIEVDDEPYVCRTGDTWLLGFHRLTIGGPDVARDADNLILGWQRASRMDAKDAKTKETFNARAASLGVEFVRTTPKAQKARKKD